MPNLELPDYSEWLSRRIMLRSEEFRPHQMEPTFSLLTTVYHGTRPRLLKELRESISSQTLQNYQWNILAHGPIEDVLRDELQLAARLARAKITWSPRPLELIDAMRVCFNVASGEYIIPVDADDLLTEDALQILAYWIERQNYPEFLYSDEDILANGSLRSPYLRPDWDPVLNLENSYIWHLCAIRRDHAIALNLYSDASANWCHDWDSVNRTSASGIVPVHVPEVLYHWRHHAASSTNNSSDQHSGSLRSTALVLRFKIAGQLNPDRYEIAPFPVYRGAEEWYIQRRLTPELKFDVLTHHRRGAAGQDPGFAPFSVATPQCANLSELSVSDNPSIAELRSSISTIRHPYVLVCDQGIRLDWPEAILDCIKIMEFEPTVCMVGGKLVDERGQVLAGADCWTPNGRLVSTIRGLHVGQPGQFALALKPHCVAAAPSGCFIARTDFLARAFNELPGSMPMGLIGAGLGAAGLGYGYRIAFNPLFVGRLSRSNFWACQSHEVRAVEVLLRGDAFPSMGAMRFAEARTQFK